MDEKSIQILLVEDDESHVELIRRAFELRAGRVNLRVARSLGQVRECLAQSTPDLLIADLRLPDGDALELLPGETGESTFPIMILTAQGDERAAVEALKAGALDYVVKSETTFADLPHIAESAMREWENIIERKRAEEALRESEQRYRNLFDQAPLSIWEEDFTATAQWMDELRSAGVGDLRVYLREHTEAIEHAAGLIRVVDVNEGTLTMFEAESREALLTTPPGDAGDPTGRSYTNSTFVDQLVAIWNGQGRFETEFCATTLKGNQRECLLRWAAPCGRKGLDLSRVIVAISDITERKQAEQERTRLAAALESAGEAILITDVTGSIEYVNAAFERIHGFSCEEALGKNPRILKSGKHDVEFYRDLWNTLLRGEVWRGEITNRNRNGSLVHVEETIAPIRNAAGEIINFVAVERDITDRKQADAALRDRERQFRELIESAPDAILLTDSKGTITVVNARTEAMFGYRRQELVGQQVEMLIPERLRADHVARRERVVRDPTCGPLRNEPDLIGLRQDGSEFPVAINLGPIHTARGPFVVSTIRDQTDRQRLESQLRQAQKLDAVGTLASGIAHDFSNALTAIFGYTDLARRTLAKDHPAHEALDMIEQAAQQTRGVTNSLLTFTRRSETEKTAVNLGVVLGEAVQLLRRMLPATIEIITDISPASPVWVLADATQMHQILMNLAINSRDAMPDGGTLHVVLADDGDDPARSAGPDESTAPRRATFTVEDTGVGMPDEVRSRIFEPFYTTKERGQGTGLGMSLIHGIITSHGGQIEVASQVGQGTKVSVTLPRCSPPAALDSPRTASGATNGLPGRGELILVVEDDSHVRSIIRSALSSNGYVVLEAADGLEAREVLAARASGIRLVLLDLDLPKLSGLSVLREIRRQHKAVATMVITGDVDVDLHHELLEGERLLRKPFSVPELVQAVQASLAAFGEERVSC